MKKQTIYIIGAIAVVLIVGIFVIWKNMSYSKEVLKLEILGPEEVSVGENMEYVVRFKNNGNIRLEEPELTFEYPDGAITENDKIVLYDADKLGGNIYPGQERTFKFDARLLGEQGDIKIAKATLSFKPKDLNSRSEVYTEFVSTIEEVPISLDLTLPSKITSADKAFSFSINYTSDVSYALEDLSIFITYPQDFEYLYSNPKPLDETQWDIPTLSQYESGRIEISGVMNDNASNAAFVVRMGIWDNSEFIMLKEVTSWLSVISSPLYISQKINNEYDYVAELGDSLHYEIDFRNIGEDALTDLVLVCKLDGDLLDLDTLSAPDAKYTQGDDSILFEPNDNSALQFLDVGESGTVEFWVDLKDGFTMTSLSQADQNVKNKVTIGQTREEFITKVASNLKAVQYVDTSGQYFTSSGPYPLEVNKTSKLTIVWEVINDFNNIENAYMRAIIPENGTFVDHDEEYEDMGLSYNTDNSELVWDIGSIASGAGYVGDTIKAEFQIIVSPQIAVPGGVLIIGPAHISGEDQWTGQDVDYKTEELKAEIVGGNIAE